MRFAAAAECGIIAGKMSNFEELQMKLHYMGKYNLDPDSLPHGEHKPGAVKFREAGDTAELSRIVSKYSLILLAVLMTVLLYRYRSIPSEQWLIGFVLFLASLFPHELLHALCFRGDVYLYTNLLQGMLFVVGTEDMSKGRFVFMSLLPNIIFGLAPFVVAMALPDLGWLGVFGVVSLTAGAGDFYNIKNALTQMPKHARCYLYKYNSYWYMP